MSRTPRPFVAIGFATTHDALAAEDLLAGSEVDALTIPVPEQMSDLCGIALRISPSQQDAALRMLEDAGIKVREVVEIEDV